jgi:outer membrane protein assembly factor BamB
MCGAVSLVTFSTALGIAVTRRVLNPAGVFWIMTYAGTGAMVIAFYLGVREVRFPFALAQRPDKVLSGASPDAAAKQSAVQESGRGQCGSGHDGIPRRRLILGTAGLAASAGAAGIAVGTLGRRSRPPTPIRKPAWTFSANSGVECTPLISAGVMYVGDLSGEFYAVHLATRTKLWSRLISPQENLADAPILSRPAVAGALVYVGSYGGGVYSLETASGDLYRTYHTAEGVFGGITVAGDFAYFASMDGTVHAIHAAKGEPAWVHDDPGLGDIKTTPAVADGVVYVGSGTNNGSGYVYALDAVHGGVRWTHPMEGAGISSPAVVNGVLYVGTDPDLHMGFAYALDARDGTQLWKRPTGDWIFECNPAVAGGLVYIGDTKGDLYALETATGRPRWVCHLGAEIQGSPAVSGGVVYIGCRDGKFHAVDAVSGEALWTGITGDQIDAGPAVADGLVYIGSADRRVYAFGTDRPGGLTR